MSPTTGPTYAGFWRRLAAHLIDKLLIGIVLLIVFVPLFAMIGISVMSHDSFDDTSASFVVALISAYFVAIVLAIIGEWLYFAIMESMKGATIGKMALGIKVTDMNGERISFGRATGRYFGKILSSLTLCVGYIIIGFSQQKQGLHDIIARTLVVMKY
jgi:uncharacterized RDD family membrane protein YckC